MPGADAYRGRLLRLRYRYRKVEKLLSLGSYPEVPLKRAREKRDEARRLLADGVDPRAQRKTNQQAQGETFEVIAREWLGHRAKTSAAVTMAKAQWLLEMLFSRIGRRPIREVTPPELLAALRKIEARGHRETAYRAKQKCGQVFRYAIVTGRAERDISADLRGALVPVVSRNHASLTIPLKLGPCSVPSMVTRGSPSLPLLRSWRRWSSFVLGSCGVRVGRSSISMASSGAFLRSA
jgi:hypothetical protein